MILIRGIKGEQYAKRIEKGIVDCRDVLSSLLQPLVTGYEYSDYYEKNLVKAITYFLQKDADSIHEPKVLYSILIDYYIPHIYLTYFHVLNDRSLEWLEKFDNDYSFIALNIKLDRICILRSTASADAFNVGRYAEHNGRLIHVTARSLVESQLCNAWLLVS